jgi:ABC-type multidrug transport system ATPase subunit
LWNGGVVDKQVKTFSGGMKRRLSVAISLIGDPQVVYLDEPSTGLDPSSRQNLWSVVKSAKAGRGIILTTHSMEEAAALCDRLGIFVDGQLVCIGAPKELTARYGGYLVFTATTAPGGEAAIEAFVHRLSPSAKLTYAVGETFKYELSTSEVSLSTVFGEMESAVKSGQVQILDWGVANATLEEVFIKFAKSIGAEGGN